MKTCFMFGHSDTPPLGERLLQAMQWCYAEQNVRCFIVGSRGNFDCIEAVAALRALRRSHSDIEILRLLAYHPALARRETEVSAPFDGTYYPCGLEKTPLAFAVRRANEIMVAEADVVICYVSHPGNTKNLLEYAGKKQTLCLNLARGDGRD